MTARLAAVTWAICVAAASLPTTVRAQWDTQVLLDSGPQENRFNLVILGDGYTNAERTVFLLDATDLVNTFFNAWPMDNYASFFNAIVVYVDSNESGADHPSLNTYKDTALDAEYECYGIDRLICINYNTAASIATQAVPQHDMIAVLVNDPEYGGSGGSAIVVSTHFNTGEMLRHEFAHPVADLADEYEDPYPGFPACDTVADCPEPNVTLRTSRADIKWNDWIDASTPVPTPNAGYDTAVGLFEGARYESTGVYRPMFTCRMRELFEPFCPVCGEALITAFFQYVDPIDSLSPSSPVQLDYGQTMALTVDHIQNADGTIGVRWFAGNTLRTDWQSASVSVSALELGAAVVNVRAVVQDATTAVRTADAALLTSTREWSVDATAGACGDGVVNGPEACDDPGGTTCAADCSQILGNGDGGGSSDGGGTGGSGEHASSGCACRNTAASAPLLFFVLPWALALFIRRAALSH